MISVNNCWRDVLVSDCCVVNKAEKSSSSLVPGWYKMVTCERVSRLPVAAPYRAQARQPPLGSNSQGGNAITIFHNHNHMIYFLLWPLKLVTARTVEQANRITS